MKRITSGFFLLALLTMIGCSSNGPVVFAPNTSTSDEMMLSYTHPSRAFTLEVPGRWSVYVEQTPILAAAAFTPPGMSEPALKISAIRLQSDLQSQDINTLIDIYYREIRPDARYYTLNNVEAMGDGSWRLTGLLANRVDAVEQVNTFIDRQEGVLSIIEVMPVDDPILAPLLERAVNTLTLNTETELESTTLLALTSDTSGPYAIINVSTWLTPEGIFFVTGEVANYTDQAVVSIPIRVELLTNSGTGVLEAFDTTMGYAISAGGFAPFSLRFGQGQPPDTSRYQLILGNDTWRDDPVPPRTVYTGDSLQWTSEQTFTPEGFMLISGAVTNTGSTTVYDPVVYVTVFDDQQRVIAAGFIMIDPAELATGEVAEYQMRISELGGEPANYIVEVQGIAQ